ncbi:MAG: outer-membrane lipoprotein carrier protein LolA, partial [Telluria sp.]
MKFTTKAFATLIATGAIALSGTAHATALDQFKSFVSTTKSAKGDFTQQQLGKSKSGKAAPISSGSFVFARPGKFIWTYQKPCRTRQA